jgi:copper chaperone CopZ
MAVQTLNMSVTGMTCGNCAHGVERTLAATPGVTKAAVNLEAGAAIAEYDPDRVTPEALVNAVRELGYGAKA